MTGWTTPKTWTTGEALLAADLNTHLRDNLLALKGPATESYECDEGADYTTVSTSFVDVDATNLALTIVTTGGDVLVHFHGDINNSAAAAFLEVDQDGAKVGGDDGILKVPNVNNQAVSFTRLITGLSAASHTFKLQWKVVSGTATLYAGAGTANNDVHPQFWVREI